MNRITIYHKPSCTTCRQAVQILKDSGQAFTAINYYDEPFTKAQLQELLRLAGLSTHEVLRTKEDLYKELQLGEKMLTDDQLLDLMVKHPDLIQRPIVQKGGKALLARPADAIKTLL